MARKSKLSKGLQHILKMKKKHRSMSPPKKLRSPKNLEMGYGLLRRNTDFEPMSAWDERITEELLENFRAVLFERDEQGNYLYLDEADTGGKTPCLEWSGPKDQNGIGTGPWQYGPARERQYGLYLYGSNDWGKNIFICTHQLAWRLRGDKKCPPSAKLPNDGQNWELDHAVCDNKKCCNWEHLEPVPHKENVRRAEVRKIRGLLVETPAATEKKYQEEGSEEETQRILKEGFDRKKEK